MLTTVATSGFLRQFMEMIQVTERDEKILMALVLKVRLFSQRQIANHWWNGDVANARRRLRQLTADHLVSRVTVPVRALSPLTKPMLCWEPGDARPNADSIAYRLKRRLRNRPIRSVTAWVATERSGQLFGGRCRGELKHRVQATHDLGVSGILLHFDACLPQWAEAWQGEDLLAHTRRGEKLPDAFIVDAASNNVVCVIEFGGDYDARRIHEFHADCVDRDLPYQLW
ncbi:MAG: hypothetical protein GY903_21015 [Fuerstiella sp.]|nr:hypothetical protein [Fuerstiella sp.]MCP4856972.1 hypothetical protein [Fuerstiella sp.]